MESSHRHRGKLTIYLGYSPGVGKTYEMLSNGIDLYKEGVDIKIGYIEPHQRPETSALAKQLPEIKTSSRKFGSHLFHFIDVNQIVEGIQMLCLSTSWPIRISQNTTFKALHGY